MYLLIFNDFIAINLNFQNTLKCFKILQRGDCIGTWAWGQKNARWPGGMQNKLTTRMSPFHPPYTKMQPYRSPYDLPGVVIMSSLPSCSTGQAQTQLLGNLISKESPPLLKSLSFLLSPLCPQLRKALSRASPELVERIFLSSVLPPLCSSISLIKSVSKIFWVFLSISVLGNPRTPMQITMWLELQ